MDSNNIVLSKNSSVNKKVQLNNIEPVTNIKVIREPESSISSSSSSDNNQVNNKFLHESSSDVSVSDVSIQGPKPKKKVLRKVPKSNTGNLNDYNTFSNPKKTRPQEMESEDSLSEYSSSANDSYSDYSGDSVDSERISFKEQQKMKQDLLIKIQALEKKGYEFTKKFTMTSDYREMEFEYEKIKKFIETQGAIKFSRRCLMACVTGLEFLNKKFDPFAVKLDGWSENVMENIDDYDNVFEKLHEKYSGKAEIAPELELLLTLGGSAFMFHLTNSLLKSPTFEGITQIGQNAPSMPGMNPNFMSSMMGAMSQGMKEMNAQKQPGQFPPVFPQGPQQGPPKPVETRGQRKEMRGPTLDTSLFGNVVNNYPMPPAPMEYSQQFEDDRFSIASSDSDSSSNSIPVKKIITNKNNKKGIELNIS